MPPKGKSSGSSHSSRSRSSSSSSRSSYHSSSSSYSSSYGSSHSSRSRTTTASSSYKSSGVDTGYSTREYKYPKSSGRRNYSTLASALILHDALHNYTYFPSDHTDANGVIRQSGYYDENGNWYKKGNFDNQTMELTCPYCDSRSKIVWTEGALPRCPVCGGTYDEVQRKAAPTRQTSSSYSSKKAKKKKAKPFIVIAAIIAVLGGLYLFGKNLNTKTTSSGYKTVQQVNQPSKMDIFVEEIGRTCSWDTESEWWYDKKSGCYFYFDETIAPSQWKYWYDGIGDDYGDYGWMEFDDDENTWYIEVSEKNWEVLPDKYDTKGLWHMKDAFQEPVLNE